MLLLIRKIQIKTQRDKRLAMPNVAKDLNKVDHWKHRAQRWGWKDVDDQGSQESFGGELSVSFGVTWLTLSRLIGLHT